jgi:hypothetical protein
MVRRASSRSHAFLTHQADEVRFGGMTGSLRWFPDLPQNAGPESPPDRRCMPIPPAARRLHGDAPGYVGIIGAGAVEHTAMRLRQLAMATGQQRACYSGTPYFSGISRNVLNSGRTMATRYESRHPTSTVPASTVLSKTHPRSPRYGVKPLASLAIRSRVKPQYPQIGDRVRLWDYVESEWIEGNIESIQPGYRILVRSVEGLEETFGWHLAFREGAWVEDAVGVTG